MAIVNKGNPRSRQSGGSNVPSLERAGSVNPVVDGRKIWYNRPVGIFSFPNTTDDTAYMRVDVANLNNNEYEITLESGVLNSSDGINYPGNLTPNFNSGVSPALQFRRFADSQSLSGAMFAIPPQSRVHIALRLTHDRTDTLDFPVAFYEHAGPDRDSPVYSDTPILRQLEWIPAPSADAVTTALYSTPRRFLFWDLAPEPDWVRFRPWNVTPRAGRFPWTLFCFHHPECVVRITNRSPFAVTVTPRLLLSQEDKEGNPIQKMQEELLTNASLAPGEEREWPCALSLSDTRRPKLEADQMRIRATADVFDPSAAPVGKINAPETIKTEYQSYPSKIIDWVMLLGMTFCLIGFLIWLTVGIPIPVTPTIDVKLHFKELETGELPSEIKASNPLRLKLSNSSGDYTGIFDPSDKTFRFKFPLTVAWWPRCPLPWQGKEDTFDVNLSDDKGKYQFTPLKAQKLTIFPAPHPIQVLGEIDYTASTEQTKQQEAGHALGKANEELAAATQLLQQKQPARAQLDEAGRQLNKADTLLAGLPAGIPEKTLLDKAQGQLVASNQQEAQVEKSLSEEAQRELKAEGDVNSALENANLAMRTGKIAMQNSNKPDAVTQAQLADDKLSTLDTLMVFVKEPAAKARFEALEHTAKTELAQLKTAINAVVPPPQQATEEQIQAEKDVRKRIVAAYNEIRAGRASLQKGSKEEAITQAQNAGNYINDASAGLKGVFPATQGTLSSGIETQRQALAKLQQDIDNYHTPVRRPAWEKAYFQLMQNHMREAILAAQTDPNDVRARAISAIAYMYTKDEAGARTELNAGQALSGTPGDKAYLLTAQAFLSAPNDTTRLSQYNQAIAAYDANDPGLPLAYILKLRLLVNSHGTSPIRDNTSKISTTVRQAAASNPRFKQIARQSFWLTEMAQPSFYEGNNRHYIVSKAALDFLFGELQ